jgi:outer membrane protein assembly factor BamB
MSRHLAAALVTATLAATVSAADWPTFRGNPTQTGIAPESLPDRLVERWKYQTTQDRAGGGIESTAAVVNGVAYVGAFDEQVHAVDLATGRAKWTLKVGAVKAPVGVHGGRVYAGNVDGVLHCVDAATGKEVWKFEAGGEVTSGPNFGDGTVLFGSQDETLYCLNVAGGKLKWKYQINGGPVMGTPAVAGGRTFAAGCDSTLHVLDAATGNELAAVEVGGQVGASAAARDGVVYLGTMTNQVVAVDLAKKEVAWTFEPARRQQPFYASAAVTDKLVIIGSRDKRVYALDRAKGTEVWSFATEGKVDSSPVVAGGRVYFGSQDGNLYVLNVADGKEVQRIKLDGPVTASPAVGGGCLVVGTEKGTLYGFGAGRGN